jgi:hypothetical protein
MKIGHTLSVKNLRQLLFPIEFRISTPGYPQDTRARLSEAIEHFMKNWPPPPASSNQDARFLTDLATGLWRVRRNMVPPGSPRLLDAHPLEGMRKPFRWLVSVWDALKEHGLEIQDHTGDRYNSGQRLSVPAFEPVQGIAEETVIDTVKPSVYFGGEMIQMGEVIVGTPETPSAVPADGLKAPSLNRTEGRRLRD